MDWESNKKALQGSLGGGYVPSYDSTGSMAVASGDQFGLIPSYLDYDEEAAQEEDDDLYFRQQDEAESRGQQLDLDSGVHVS
jgi:hypothetical protein